MASKKKHGSNKPSCQAYRLRQQRERNKARKLAKHMKRFANDLVALAAYSALPLAFQKANPV